MGQVNITEGFFKVNRCQGGGDHDKGTAVGAVRGVPGPAGKAGAGAQAGAGGGGSGPAAMANPG